MSPSSTRSSAGKGARDRGRSWEAFLAGLFGLLGRSGVCHAMRTSEPMQRLGPGSRPGAWECIPQREGLPDYLVCYRGRGLALEAKRTEDARWRLGDLRAHQAQHLDAWQRAGGVSALLLSIEGEQLALPWATLGPLWHAWADQGERAAPGTASIPAAQLRAMGVELDLAGAWLGWLCDATPTRGSAPRPPEEDPPSCPLSMS